MKINSPKYYLAGIFGTLINPTIYKSTQGEGLFRFISIIFRLITTIAGIYMVFQLITAGMEYISASGDMKKTENAWNKIWQSLLGIVIIASAFVLASVMQRITGINILNPVIYGP